MATDDALASVQGVTKHFDATVALQNVSVDIRRGEIHALVGENGAGKSTLGRIIAGALRPDVGAVLVEGRPVRFRSPHDAIRHGIVAVPQESVVVPEQTVIENVLLGAEPRRGRLLNRRLATKTFAGLTERYGWHEPPNARAGRLGVGDQQKVAILRALARQAKVLVMDEPTAAMSTTEAQAFLATLQRLRAEGQTVLYVSHFLEHVLAVADSVTVLRNGRVIRSGPAKAETRASLITAMLGEASHGDRFPDKQVPGRGAEVVVRVSGLSTASGLRDVSLALRRGEILGVAGLAGSGRTRLARALFGIDRITAGTFRLRELDCRFKHPAAAIDAGIAFMPEDRKRIGLHLGISVADNMTLPHLRSRAPRRERDAVIRATMDRLDVRPRAPRAAVASLSGGNQQKVLLGKWMLGAPTFLIVDEPTRGVDVRAKHELYKHLTEIAADGTPILFISSELDELQGMAHRIIVMSGGRVSAELSGDAAQEDIMRHAFSTSAGGSAG